MFLLETYQKGWYNSFLRPHDFNTYNLQYKSVRGTLKLLKIWSSVLHMLLFLLIDKFASDSCFHRLSVSLWFSFLNIFLIVICSMCFTMNICDFAGRKHKSGVDEPQYSICTDQCRGGEAGRRRLLPAHHSRVCEEGHRAGAAWWHPLVNGRANSS